MYFTGTTYLVSVQSGKVYIQGHGEIFPSLPFVTFLHCVKAKACQALNQVLSVCQPLHDLETM